MAFGEEVFEEEGEALFGGGLDYEVRGGFDLLGGIAHSDSEARPLDHVDVVGAVPDGDDFLPFYCQRDDAKCLSAAPLLPSGWPISQR